MALNNMIPQYRSPVATYSALRQQRDKQASNAVNMLATGQDMRAQQQKMNLLQSAEQREISDHQKEQLALIGKTLDRFPTEQEKKSYFDSVLRGDMEQYFDLPSVPPEIPYEQLAPAIEAAKLKIYGEPEAPKTRSRLEGYEKVYDQWNPSKGKYEEVSRGYPSETTAGPGELSDISNRQQSTSQDEIVMAMELEDNLWGLRDAVRGSEGQLTVWGSAGGSLLKMGERLGVPLPDDAEGFLQDRQKIKNYAGKVYTTYRRLVTGSQASKFELKELRNLAPTEDDSVTTMRQKIRDWSDFAERLRIRHERVLSQGYRYIGKDDNENALYRKDSGEVKEISEIVSLKNIQTAEQRKTQVMRELAGGKSPDELTQQQIENIKNATRQKLMKEGYNMRRWQ